ncbi:MAG: metalloprotease, partial [Bacteroidota bacterium]
MNLGASPRNFVIFTVLLLLGLVIQGQQHSNTIDATLNDETKAISVKQKLTYFNGSDSTLRELYFNDWNHAYSGKNSSLAKRFGDYFRKSLHLAKERERGFTKNINLVGKEYQAIKWDRYKYNDIIKVSLEEPLAPGDSIELFWSYIVKLPNSKFTDYGYGYENGYYLKDWYLTPAVYDGEWHLYPNTDLNDQYTGIANSQVNLIFPDSLYMASNFNASSVSKFPNGQHVILKDVDRKNCTIFLTKEDKFVRHNTPSFNVLTDIKGERYSEMAQGFSIVRVTDFITKNLGEFPQDHLLVSEADYNRNPLYGINQLPRFIRPYSQQFQFELKFLKTALYSFVRETLYLNVRKEQWVHDAIVNYLLIKYVDQFYPNKKLTGQLSKIWGFRGYNLAKMDFNDQYYYLQMASVRRNDHQALSTPNDSLTRFNQKIANRYKAGLGLAYLAEFIGYDKLDESLKEFYVENRVRPKLTAEVLKEKLRSKTKLDILWFFDEYVALRNNIDFKITKVSKQTDSIYFSIKNRTGSNVPIS